MVSGAASRHEGREERRRRRVVVDLPATIRGRSPRPARVADLSLAGCLLRSEAPLDEGTVVDLEVELPGAALRTKARVAECSVDGDSLGGPAPGYLAGLEFLALPAADEARLRAFLEAASERRRGAPAPPD